MFNANSGYEGYSRSVRSQTAIDDYEMPLSMFKKSVIEDFILDNPDFEGLKNVSVSLWKFSAKQNGSSSWHHTGKFFNETDHYDMYEAANNLSKNLEQIKAEYKSFRANVNKEKQQLKSSATYCVLEEQIWGGTRKHPHITGYEKVAGIKIGDWVYSINGSKYNAYARKAENMWNYNSYNDLIKEHTEFKSTKVKFNHLIKEHLEEK